MRSKRAPWFLGALLSPATLVGIILSGCTSANPEFCGAGCDLTAGTDLQEGPGDLSGADLSGPDSPDLRGSGSPDLHVQPDLRAQPDLSTTCMTGADCPSGVCLPDGVCGAAGSVVYVDNGGGGCTGDHAGTQADPVCTLDGGVTVARNAGRHLIHVAGSAAGYSGVSIDGLTLSFFGPGTGTGASPTADITGQVQVSGAASVLLTGLELSTAADDQVLCSSGGGVTPALEITQSYVHNAQGFGVHGKRCSLKVRRSVIIGNGQGGVNAEGGGEVLVENSFIAINRGPGVRTASGTGRVRFCTLVGNGSLVNAGPGAVDCGTTPGSTLDGTLIYKNGKALGLAGQVSAGCKMTDSATDDSSFANGSNNHFGAKPVFAGATDLHLLRAPGSEACCIDQVAKSDVLVDYDGTVRPQGPKWDIGAHEVK